MRKAQNREKRRVRLAKRFGTLSDREMDLVEEADRIGYQRGYHKARKENRDEVAHLDQDPRTEAA